MKDDRSVRQRQIEKKLGKAAGRAVFAALTTSYVAVILVGASAWGSFALAGKLLAEAYPYKATSPILPMVVYSWLQGFPGAVLYALQVACLFAFKSKKEKQKAREDLREQVQEEPRLFGGFGPQIRLSREFYLGSRIQRIVIISLVLFGVSGVPLMAGFGASSTAQIWEILVVIADGILAAVLVGVFGGWLASRMISRVSLGPETSDDDRAGRNRAALAYMLGSIPGSIFSSVAGICPILLGSASGNADQGSYAFWSHLGGALCGMLAVYSHERIVSRKV